MVSSFRNTVMGMASTSSRIGGILAPFCAQLDHIMGDLSLIILGLVSLGAGVRCFSGRLLQQIITIT